MSGEGAKTTVHVEIDLEVHLPKKAGQEADYILINADSEYYAFASAAKSTVAVGAPGTTSGQEQVWKFTLVDATNQNYYIRSVSADKYAFVAEPPKVGTQVTLSDDRRLWQVRLVPGCRGQLAITPVGEKVGSVWWANLVPGQNEPVTIQVPAGQKHHWIVKKPE